MGPFKVQVEIGDPSGSRFERVDALLDTGATYTVLPESLLRRLGVEPFRRDQFQLADGRVADRDVGQTWVRFDGRSAISMVVFGGQGIDPLLGAHAWRACC